MFSLEPLIACVIALFVIMDPFSSLPTFLLLTKKETDKRKSALIATAVSATTLAVFVLVGTPLMNALSISMPAFQIAGGLLLLLTAIVSFFGIEIKKTDSKDLSVAVVVVAVPLLTGPGAMAISIILSANYGAPTVLAAIAIMAVAIYVILSSAKFVDKILGANGIEILSKVVSILLAAIAVEFIKAGTQTILQGWSLIS